MCAKAVHGYTNPYATDGVCHNANYGDMNRECGKPASWLGVTGTGFATGFCTSCKHHGDERHRIIRWIPLGG